MSGPFGASQFMYASGGFYPFEITNSLRLDYVSQSRLKMTPSSSPTSAQKFTMSYWLKRTQISASNTRTYFLYAPYSGGDGSNESHCSFDDNNGNGGSFRIYDSGTSRGSLVSVSKFRDSGAWVNIVCAVDTTQGTAGDRVKLYINGVQSSFTGTQPAQDVTWGWNGTTEHCFGSYRDSSGSFGDYYVADFNMIDGQQLAASSFGEFKSDIWVPKDTSGLTFGTNGVRLEFKQTGTSADSSGIGADTSGNDHHFSVTNLSAHDVVSDSPTNNFCTMNSVDTDPDVTFSEGNLKLAVGSSPVGGVRGTFGLTSGKWYWEVFNNDTGNGVGIGVFGRTAAITAWPSIVSGTLYITALKNVNGTESSYGATYTDDDIIGVALNCDDGEITFYKNNASQGTLSTIPTTSFPAWADGATSASATATVNFGQDSSFAGAATAQNNTDGNGIGDFYYAPPTGFLALCTSNLSAPAATIDPNQGGSPQDYFHTKLYTGNGSTQSITGVGFQPNFTWIKNRGQHDDHALTDSVRGVTKELSSDNTDAEITNADGLTAFGADGFSLGDDDIYNTSSESYVSWNWKAETAFSNDASATGVGALDSAGTINTDVGFAIIGYTGTGSATTIAHGLGKKPQFIIAKNREGSDNWRCYAESIGAGKRLQLHDNSAEGSSSSTWNNTEPTTAVFSVGSADETNHSSEDMIAYLFTSIDGYSSIGEYKGNNDDNGTFVYTGFRPAFILIKRTSSSGDWLIYDSKRDGGNGNNAVLYPAEDIDEENQASRRIDILSNGFKPRTSNSNLNGSSDYFYYAIAAQPFKYSNGR